MTDTQTLVGTIAALRKRLEQAQGLAREATSAVGSLDAEDRASLESLRRQAAVVAEVDETVDASLRRLGEVPAAETQVYPDRLTARARRVLERGRELLGRLRALGENLSAEADPLRRLYRDTSAMTEATVRMVQTFPDEASTQLRLSEGLEVILGVVGQRIATLGRAVGLRLQEEEKITTLSELLIAIASERISDIRNGMGLAECLMNEARDSSPLRFVHATPALPARFVACHSLTVGRVMARVARQDPDMRARPLEPILAALLHDVGMLHIPSEILAQTGPLNDVQRRTMEAHARLGAERLRQLWPDAPWLAEAAAGHHERMDGTGYPSGLRGTQVSSLTRLLAVCDVYAALCAPRPHRPARETRTALTDTLLMADAEALDRQHAERLLPLSFYPIGSVVEMADGAVGVVVATPLGKRDLSSPARPVVAVLTSPHGQPLASPLHVDLAQSEGRSIVRSLGAEERRNLLAASFPEWA